MYITHRIPEVIEERETTKDTGLEGQIYPFPESPNCPSGCGAPKPSLTSPGVGKSIPGEKPGARKSLRVKGEGSGDTGNDSNSGGWKMRDFKKRQRQGREPVCSPGHNSCLQKVTGPALGAAVPAATSAPSRTPTCVWACGGQGTAGSPREGLPHVPRHLHPSPGQAPAKVSTSPLGTELAGPRT